MADPTGARTTNGVDKVAFPVLLGSVDDPDDGLIGLTCLVDPRCPMHATTGYLPTQSMQIPTEMFRDAVARMAVTFLTAPI
jgi:hypothetical protein